MSRKQKRDPLREQLSAMQPLQPRPGLEQEIYARIMQEPAPAERPRRINWQGIRSAAAVASFAAALLLLGSFLFMTRPGSNQMLEADKPSAGNAANDSAPPASKQRASGPASLANSNQASLLTRGVRITLSEPATDKARTDAQQMAEQLTAEDFNRILQELYKAGAEWIRVNGVSVSMKDTVQWNGNGVSVKGAALSPPYLLEVSGDPAAIQQAVERKGSQIDTLRQAAKIGVTLQPVSGSK